MQNHHVTKTDFVDKVEISTGSVHFILSEGLAIAESVCEIRAKAANKEQEQLCL